MAADSILRFEDYELDLEAGELRKRGLKIKLAPQPFKLLCLLANSRGRVLTRDAIRQQLWSSTFVDFEHGLNFCVREVRKVLRDRVQRPKFIETLPKRGYRFIATISGNHDGQIDSRVDAADRYAAGRMQLRHMGVETLEQAKKSFEEALELDPQFAMAHCGLGASYAMRFICRAEPRDLISAKCHLERAMFLDSELAEPYPWLCYVHMRCGDLAQALETGQRGVQLLPDLVHAQYFLGLTHFLSCETGSRNYQLAVNHLSEAGSVEPRWSPTWFVLAWICLLNAEYGSAGKFADRLFQHDGADYPVSKFPGAENLMGMLSLRQGDTARAYDLFTRSLAALSASDHAYTEAMKASSECGLGDVSLRQQNTAAALSHYRKAWHIVQESRAFAGQERHGVRALAGLAAGYALAGERDRAIRLLAQGEELLEKCSRPQASAAGANLADLHYACAVAYLSGGDEERSMAHLRHAFQAGWNDALWLQRDPELKPLRSNKAFSSLLIEIQAVPRLVMGN